MSISSDNTQLMLSTALSPSPPTKYGINLMWLNKTLVDGQEWILPTT
jgi:hypothetical protein